MTYVGGKQKLSKFICPILQKELDNGNYTAYIEPFGGGGNIISNINYNKRCYYDKNYYLVEFWKALKSGWDMPEPSSINKEIYDKVRDSFKKRNGEYPDYYYGYMMFIPSYNGKMWGSYAKDNETHKYCDEHTRNVLKQLESMSTVDFYSEDYNNLSFENCLIYCDPPYKDSKRQYYDENFNYDNFYDWCREQSKNNKIYISETNMPDDFEIVWQKDYKRTLSNQTKGIKTVEKLFTI